MALAVAEVAIQVKSQNVVMHKQVLDLSTKAEGDTITIEGLESDLADANKSVTETQSLLDTSAALLKTASENLESVTDDFNVAEIEMTRQSKVIQELSNGKSINRGRITSLISGFRDNKAALKEAEVIISNLNDSAEKLEAEHAQAISAQADTHQKTIADLNLTNGQKTLLLGEKLNDERDKSSGLNTELNNANGKVTSLEDQLKKLQAELTVLKQSPQQPEQEVDQEVDASLEGEDMFSPPSLDGAIPHAPKDNVSITYEADDELKAPPVESESVPPLLIDKALFSASGLDDVIDELSEDPEAVKVLNAMTAGSDEERKKAEHTFESKARKFLTSGQINSVKDVVKREHAKRKEERKGKGLGKD